MRRVARVNKAIRVNWVAGETWVTRVTKMIRVARVTFTTTEISVTRVT